MVTHRAVYTLMVFEGDKSESVLYFSLLYHYMRTHTGYSHYIYKREITVLKSMDTDRKVIFSEEATEI